MRGSKNDTTIIKCNLSSANGKNKIDRYHLLFNNYSLQSTQKLLIKVKILYISFSQLGYCFWDMSPTVSCDRIP